MKFLKACLLKQPFVKDPDKTIEQLVVELAAKLGENVQLKGFAYLSI